MPPSSITAEASSSSNQSAPASKGKAKATGAATSKLRQDLPASFSVKQAEKAVNALLSHATKVTKEKSESELLPKEDYVWLCLALKAGSTKKKVTPTQIQLPHPPLPPPPATSICLLSKDPQREYKDLLEAQNIKFISRVVGVDKLKGKFKPYEARRQLLSEHEVFLADERIMGYMPALLGKKFYESKKLPIPVNMKKKDLKTELAKAISSTYYIPNTGTQISIRIGTPSSTTSQLLENLLSSIPQTVNLQKGTWDNILSIGIKTSSSVLLPVWQCDSESRFEIPQEIDEKEKKVKRKSVFEEYAEEEAEDEKRRKRFLGVDNDDDEDQEEKSEKKEEKAKKSKKEKKVGSGVVEGTGKAPVEEQEVVKTVKIAETEKEFKAGKENKKEVKKSSIVDKDPKKVGKKSSSIAGSASKRAKEAIVGRAK